MSKEGIQVGRMTIHSTYYHCRSQISLGACQVVHPAPAHVNLALTGAAQVLNNLKKDECEQDNMGELLGHYG